MLVTSILGFIKPPPLITTNGTLTGSAPINLYAVDTCIYMHIANLPVMNNNTFSYFGIPTYTFKIPLNSIVNNTIYFNDTNEHQKIFFNESSYVLDKLNIIIYDRTGCVLTGFYDWTMTLLIEYDEKPQQTIEYLNLTY